MKKKMNTKEKLSVIALFLLIAIIAVTTIALFFLKKPTDDTKEQVEVTATPQPEATAEPTAEPTEQNFELLESKAPTNQGITNYSEVKGENGLRKDENKTFVDENATDEYIVSDVSTLVGNHVYRQNETMATIKEDRFYQFYGNEISWCDADGWSDDLYLPRKEFTGERVYVVDYPDEVEKFHTQWKNGQAILNKTEKGKEGNIILNGRLLENCQFISYNNDYYIPLANIAQELNKQACYKDTTNATYDIPLETGDGLSILKVPYDASTIGYVTNKKFATGNNSEDAGDDAWTEEFHAGAGNSCFVPQSELSRYTGWYIYTNGSVISIVTDKLSVTDNVVCKMDQGNRSAKAQMENGGTVTRTNTADELERMLSTEDTDSESDIDNQNDDITSNESNIGVQGQVDSAEAEN